MNRVKKKLFWKKHNDKKYIFALTWDEKEELISFVDKCNDDGYHQVAVTSDMMMDIITTIAPVADWDLYKIEMMEDFEEEEDEIAYLVDESRQDNAVTVELVNALQNIQEESSIGIKRIYFQNKASKDGAYTNLFIQINGLLGLSGATEPAESLLLNYFDWYLNC